MTTREHHVATYLYPGSFFPEEITKTIAEPTFAAARQSGPDEDGYFSRDGWYAVRIQTNVEKRFTAEDGEELWSIVERRPVGNHIVGELVHWTDIEDNDRHRILITNIQVNAKDGHGVLTRCGNWQIADDWDFVVAPDRAVA